MRVHIVDRDYAKDHNEHGILSRLARLLADSDPAWTISDRPSDQADLNWFSSYIEFAERHSDFFATHTAAFFTHYEQGTPYKEFWWDLAAERIGLRLTCAPMYAEMLKATGPTRLVRAPVDRAKFTPGPKRDHDSPVVGLSGFVDRRSGRKGEDLVARLAASLADEVTFVGSGKGWPVHTRRRHINDLPDFYRGLDVLLCASRIEGVPMPPLEALSCGVPVVIPIGVGMLDLIPDSPGVYRFPAGDYGAMEQAVRDAIVGEYDPEKLRDLTEPYSVRNWVEDHRAVFEDIHGNVPKAALESDRHGKRGVYYVAFGEPARKCAQASMLSFREHVQRVEVALAATEPIGVEDVWVEVLDADIGGRSAKTRIYDLAPNDWQYVMYLDADTEIVADPSFLFKPLLDGWDMVICKNPGKYHLARNMKRSDNADEVEYTFNIIGTDELIQLNGGVFTFQRNERTAAFFRCWHQEWARWGKRDQGALLRALWQHPLRLMVLTNHWNSIVRYIDGDARQYTSAILHFPMTARRWRGIVAGRSDSAEAWAKVREWEEKNLDV